MEEKEALDAIEQLGKEDTGPDVTVQQEKINRALTALVALRTYLDTQHNREIEELSRLNTSNEKSAEFHNPTTGEFEGGPARSTPGGENNAHRRKLAIAAQQTIVSNTVFRLRIAEAALDFINA